VQPEALAVCYNRVTLGTASCHQSKADLIRGTWGNSGVSLAGRLELRGSALNMSSTNERRYALRKRPIGHLSFGCNACALLALLILAGCSPAVKTTGTTAESTSNTSKETPAVAHQIRVAAAADLKFALDEIIQEYQRTHPDSKVEATSGASGSLFAQLSHDAPFDLFLSADLQYPYKLVEQGHADASTEFKYAVGHLVVWVPQKSVLDVEKLGIQAVTDSRVKKVAIANPKHAPYGRAAEAALKSLGVYDQIQARLVLGENISQTAQFIDSGAADVGLISLSLTQSPALRDKGRFWRVPDSAYPKLEQGGVIPNQCRDLAAAQAFKAFLVGPQGGAILKKYGFDLPE
jgi:molybdate transport system substrate-binding protein